MAGRLLQRAFGAALAFLLSFAFSTAAVWAWCAAVFAMLGFGFSETVPLAVVAAALPLLSAAEHGLSRLTRLVRPPGPLGAACTGFFLAAAAASVWISLIGESRLSFPNVADLVLAGLVFGIPSGLLSHYSREAARDIVDTYR